MTFRHAGARWANGRGSDGSGCSTEAAITTMSPGPSGLDSPLVDRTGGQVAAIHIAHDDEPIAQLAALRVEMRDRERIADDGRPIVHRRIECRRHGGTAKERWLRR